MARFFKHAVTHEDGTLNDVEMVGLPANGTDEAVRPATDEDRMLYNAAYAEYLHPASPEDKDAEIAALRARVAELEAPELEAPAPTAHVAPLAGDLAGDPPRPPPVVPTPEPAKAPV